MKTTHSIAYQGEPGANSHIACAENFPDLNPLPRPSFEDAFAAVQDGAAELAMIPIENSIAGRVADIHALLPASGLHIVGETFLPIHFQLLAVPGARIEDLRTVHSHIHALGQCRKIIRRHNLKPVVASDDRLKLVATDDVSALPKRMNVAIDGPQVVDAGARNRQQLKVDG